MACGLRRILQVQEAFQYQPIKIWDANDNDITNLCQYSWSTDMTCWTNWTSIDQYNRIAKNIEGDFYLRVLLFDSFEKMSLGGKYINCYNICLDSSTTFLTDFCGETNLFQPYNNLDCALLLQQQLSDSVVCMFGIPIYYIRINPQKESVDYTFKEYFLHYVEDVKQIKLMIPDGQMPSSNPKLTEFDFDWEIDWETELSKTQFANAFGDTAYPKTGDCVYIPMMKRMWEVNAAYDEKNEGLMWRSTTWKLALVKYSDSTNVDVGDFGDIFDKWTENTYETVFAPLEKNEQERITGSSPLSSPSFAATNLFDIFMEDSVRKQYTKQDTTIIDKQYNHRGSVVARNIYRFKNENGCITYQKPICGDCGTISFIIETPGTLNGKVERDILNFGNIQVRMSYDETVKKFNIQFDKLSQELDPFKSYMVCIRWNRYTFSEELNIYNYSHRESVPLYQLRPEMYWFDFENPLCTLTAEYNNDFDMDKPYPCKIHSYPLSITNVKYYNTYLDSVDVVKEMIKYTTTHEHCVINDLARPINSGHGYTVK